MQPQDTEKASFTPEARSHEAGDRSPGGLVAVSSSLRLGALVVKNSSSCLGAFEVKNISLCPGSQLRTQP
jgi:hypothetical protein